MKSKRPEVLATPEPRTGESRSLFCLFWLTYRAVYLTELARIYAKKIKILRIFKWPRHVKIKLTISLR